MTGLLNVELSAFVPLFHRVRSLYRAVGSLIDYLWGPWLTCHKLSTYVDGLRSGV